MPSLVALGAILMVVGAVLVALQRKRTPRLRLSNVVSADVVGQLAPLFGHIGQLDAARGRLDHAIDTVVPVRGGYSPPPTHADVVRTYAVARDRLIDFSHTYLRRPPSDSLIRFAALSRCVGETLAMEEALRPSSDEVDPDDPLAIDAREDLLRRLDFLGGALRWDRRQLPAAAPSGGELSVVIRELRRGVTAYLDGLRPLLSTRRRRGPVRSRKQRAVLAQSICMAEKEVAVADGLLTRGAPVEALRTLAAVRLRQVAGPTADAAFTTACRTAAAGLRADAAAREAALAELVEQCAEILDQHVDALLSAVAADAEGRRLLHRAALRSGRTAAGQNGGPDGRRNGGRDAVDRVDAVDRAKGADRADAADRREGALPQR